jgi:hypothetical protein
MIQRKHLIGCLIAGCFLLYLPVWALVASRWYAHSLKSNLPRDDREAELEDLYHMYRAYCEHNNKPLQRAEDLHAYSNNNDNGYSAIRHGSLVVMWGRVVENNESGHILGYCRGFEDDGGPILFTNGAIAIVNRSDVRYYMDKVLERGKKTN